MVRSFCVIPRAVIQFIRRPSDSTVACCLQILYKFYVDYLFYKRYNNTCQRDKESRETGQHAGCMQKTELTDDQYI